MRGRPILVTVDHEADVVDWRAISREEDPDLYHELVTLPRGVWRLPYTHRKRPILVAVDRRGDYVSHACLDRPELAMAVRADLERLLDHSDAGGGSLPVLPFGPK